MIAVTLQFFLVFSRVALQSSGLLKTVPPVAVVVKLSASCAAGLGSIPAFAVDLFPGRVMPMTWQIEFQWLPYQAPGVIGSAPGLDGPVLVYSGWVG